VGFSFLPAKHFLFLIVGYGGQVRSNDEAQKSAIYQDEGGLFGINFR
jgi:hypothetical protein